MLLPFDLSLFLIDRRGQEKKLEKNFLLSVELKAEKNKQNHRVNSSHAEKSRQTFFVCQNEKS